MVLQVIRTTVQWSADVSDDGIDGEVNPRYTRCSVLRSRCAFQIQDKPVDKYLAQADSKVLLALTWLVLEAMRQFTRLEIGPRWKEPRCSAEKINITKFRGTLCK